MKQETTKTNVLIVGAGLAGLSAGKELNKLGMNYTIVEATDRPGGKVWSRQSQKGEYSFEMGAQFINPDMTEIVELIKKTGMTLVKTIDSAHSVHIDDEKNVPIDSIIDEATQTFEDIELKKDQPLSKGYENINDEWTNDVLRSTLTEFVNVNIEDLSSIGVSSLLDSYDSDGDDMTHQSSGPLKNVVQYLENLSKSVIHYKNPVQSIKKTEDKYVVQTESGQVYEARALILAVPPTAASRIELSEELANHYQPLLDSYTDGAVIKQSLVYNHPFWHAFFNDEKRVKGVIYTQSIGFNLSDTTTETSQPRLTLFIAGDKAKELARLTREQRDIYVMSRLVEVFGTDAQDYIDWNEDIWVEHPYYGGGYGAQLVYGKDPYAGEKLSKVFDKCIMANTEVAPKFKNFMEGAIRSGQTAVKEISQLL
ncbi:hypothetical protein GCM10008932_22210 [Alkalibacterium iburiense]|uniref:Amine oxidase domain-containing protein n=1 Tax=Alkalibacterium iburiense TaxID=290589 RepID=A0ABN0XQG2_9LACT